MDAERELSMYTIYEHPKDYPDNYIVRRWVAKNGFTEPREAILTDTLDEARRVVPYGLYRMEPDPTDDTTIVETWI